MPAGRLLRKYAGCHADRGGRLAFSPDGRLLAQTGERVRVLEAAQMRVSAHFDETGRVIGMGLYGRLPGDVH